MAVADECYENNGYNDIMIYSRPITRQPRINIILMNKYYT